MSTTRTRDRELALETALRWGDLPELSTIDRFALRLGLALILRGRRHAERTDRGEQARRSGAAGHAARSRGIAFEHRIQAGPTW